MPVPRHLRAAPITEAIIDFRVSARPGFRAERFEEVVPSLSSRFPRVEKQQSGRTTFQWTPKGAEPPRVEDLGVQGLVFYSTDSRLVAQFRIDGFTLNRLKPYTKWEELFPIAEELWGAYCSVATPESVSRLALRYINHVPFVTETTDLKAYFRAAPTLPPEVPQSIGSYLLRVTILDKERGVAAHVVQLLGADAGTRQPGVILDIDAFRDVVLAPRDPEVAATFHRLHEFKNQIFFNFLTEDALRQFE